MVWSPLNCGAAARLGPVPLWCRSRLDEQCRESVYLSLILPAKAGCQAVGRSRVSVAV